MASLKEVREDRLKKVEKLKSLGIDPYPSKSNKQEDIGSIIEAFDKFENKETILAGRVISIRLHGGLFFADIEDESGKIQVYVKSENLKPTSAEKQIIGFDDIDLIDEGDFIEATGVIVKTKRGEISIETSELRILTKSLRSLPDKYYGLKDVETLQRKRYLDLIVNEESKDLFRRKSLFWENHRKFMKDNGFIEMQIPVLEQVTGGADARPFKTHHNALDQDYYLRISLELNLKRLIGGGFEKVYSIGPAFRNEGIDDEHLQEYQMIEWYWAYADYKDNMQLAKDCITYVAKETYGTTKFKRGEHEFDLSDEWVTIDYTDIIKEKLDVDIWNDSDDKMIKLLNDRNVDLGGDTNRARLVDNLWKLVRKTIAGPAFLINEPKFMSPLAKSKSDNPNVTERFHIILAGSELANAYSELNDPVDQFERFKEQQDARDAGDDESQMMDIDFVEMLEYGMPPVSGYGHSERLFAFFENKSVRETTLFPQMKAKVDDTNKDLFDI